MQIVIDIDEELLGKINDENYQSVISWYDTSLYCAIKNGTPLPKGHGELIDKDVVLDMMNHGILEEYITTMGGVIHADR